MRIHQPTECIKDANIALQLLKEGNERFVKGELIPKVCCNADREDLCNCQNPFAIVLTCSDSRAAPEIFFDQKLGDIFIIRNAGNIADVTALGSIEYAVDHLKCRLVVVCGHSNCGAVKSASSNERCSQNLNHIIDHLMPAVKKGGSIDNIIHNNVELMVEKIKADEIVKLSETLVVGAYYDIHSGLVKWFDS